MSSCPLLSSKGWLFVFWSFFCYFFALFYTTIKNKLYLCIIMKTTIFILLAFCFYGSQKYIPQSTPQKVLILPPIQPTPIEVWIDTCAARYGVPKQVIIGVGISESGWGVSAIGRNANNLFGIRKGDGWKGRTYQTKGNGVFRAYPSQYDSVVDFCEFVTIHYRHLKGREVSRWLLYGYGNSDYEKVGFFNQFKSL